MPSSLLNSSNSYCIVAFSTHQTLNASSPSQLIKLLMHPSLLNSSNT